MLCKNEISSWHRVNSADEIWIYLKGASCYGVLIMVIKLRKLRIDSNNPIEMIPSDIGRLLKVAVNLLSLVVVWTWV